MSNLSARIQFNVPTLALHPQPEPAVIGSSGGPSKSRKAGGAIRKTRNLATFPSSLRSQGLPVDFLSKSPFTAVGKMLMVGNGVPLPMGRAVARAVRQALGLPLVEVA
jgi:DNA (cytosine-5)-methyltransferase 1